MAVDYFLKFSDQIKGESVKENHTDEIEMLSWSGGNSAPHSAAIGTGLGVGKVNVGDIVITKHMDQSSPKIFQALCKGTHLADATVTAQKAGGGETGFAFLKMKMEGVMVTSYQTGGSGGSEDMVTESVTLGFAKVTLEYFKQDTKSGAVTSTGSVSYDLQKAKAA